MKTSATNGLAVWLVMIVGFGFGISHGADLTVESLTYTHEEAEAAGFAIENDWYRAVLVPELGGRIVEWVDKSTGQNLVYNAGYGGLLDDHAERLKKPYTLKWLKKEAGEAVAELSLDGLVAYRKTVHFYADRPVLQVHYTVANHGQEPHRMLFRNVIRPGGQAFTDDERYAFSRVTGLQHGPGMGRTDDVADPWIALVSQSRQTVVGAAFRGNQLARVYSWRGSKVAPTFEFMLHQLEPGYQVEQDYTWVFCHGLKSVDYVHSHIVAEWAGALAAGQWHGDLKLVGTWEPIPELQVAVELLDGNRQPLSTPAPATAALTALDEVATLPMRLETTAELVIAVATLTAPQLPEPIVIEKAFPAGDMPSTYRRPIRWLGEANEPTPIEGWEPEVAYVVEPTAADRERGFMVYGEAGPDAGRHTETIRLHLAQREYESFPLHVHSLGSQDTVTIATEGAGLTIETFLPEEVPETLWGRTLTGLKLLPGNQFQLEPEMDRLVYIRLRAGDLSPGMHEARLLFQRPDQPAVTVTLELTVHPVRIPRHPFMGFDASNVVNYLAAHTVKGTQMTWDREKARRFLSDMHEHGVRGQSTIGVNSPVSHYWYSKLKLRATGQSLTEAIRANPERFRQRLDLPDLDFSEYDMLTEEIVRYGNTHLRWPMGSCGEGFMTNQMQLTKLIYGTALPAGDLRHQVIQEWYFRQVGRYFKDRGITRLRVTIDDEIPSEELAWWAQHAYRSQQMGFEPGVTQSAETMANDQRMNFVAPFMQYWIVGTLHEETIAKRRAQGIIKPEHWFTTYHSSANHWQPYDQMRGHCGLNGAYFDLDAVWIQTYYRWRQSEAVIYYTEDGPIGSAAWEGARDGLEDGNYLLLARRLIESLPADQQATWRKQLQAIVGRGEEATIRFVDTLSSVGTITRMGRMDGAIFKPGYDTWRFRQAKQQLLELIAALIPLAPPQAAGADYGLHPLIRDGKALLTIPSGLQHEEEAVRFLRRAAAPLAVEASIGAVQENRPYSVFFLGSVAELRERLPTLAAHPELADLSEQYPAAGEYAIRWVGDPNPPADQPAAESLVIVAPDAAGVAKAVELLSGVVTQPDGQYSHWLPGHWPEDRL